MPISPASLNGYEFNSKAEKSIYESAFKSDYFRNNEKYLFHSLNMVNTGGKKIKGEIDFVYLDNDCILFLEVKGGQVKFDSFKNQWYILGGTEPGDPFKQCYDPLFYTRDVLLSKLFDSKSVSNRLVFGIGVLIPESIKPNEFRKSFKNQMEYDPELVYDYNEHNSSGFINFILKIKKYWTEHPQFINRTGISHKELSTISTFFRKDLHFKLPISDLLKKEGDEILHLTNLQMFVLDNIQFNLGKGAIIMGGPGTGKTLLALELLKRTVCDKKRTLLVCYNKNLVQYLNALILKLQISDLFTVSNIHSLYNDSKFLNTSITEFVDNDEYWFRDLPLLFIKNLAECSKGSFDYLIIDEGQDILNEYHFEALGKLLKGGIESGNWALFMDKEFQNIYNKNVDEYFNYLREVYPSFVNILKLNCRNTISTIQRASIESGLPEMPCLRKDQVWNSEIRFYTSDSDLNNKINDIVIKMINEGIEMTDITILCFDKKQIISLINSNTKLFFESAFSKVKKINVSTIHGFKGLENKFILILGPENYDSNNIKQMALIYISNTRATSQSIFYLNKRYESIIINRIANSN